MGSFYWTIAGKISFVIAVLFMANMTSATQEKFDDYFITSVNNKPVALTRYCDIKIFNKKISYAYGKKLNELSMPEIFISISRSFIGTEYQRLYYDNSGSERLVSCLSGMDCMTFVEYALAIAMTIKSDEKAYSDYLDHLLLIRYRNGKLENYTSRLHYFSDWIDDSQKKSICIDITKALGGIPYKKDICYLTRNVKDNQILTVHPEYVDIIRRQEQSLTQRMNDGEYHYIPIKDIPEAVRSIHDGDIIALTTDIEGLDISHVGIACHVNGSLHFLHAPSTGSRVQISKMAFIDYIKSNKKTTGIMVLRFDESLK
jgi:hypothetical protein